MGGLPPPGHRGTATVGVGNSVASGGTLAAHCGKAGRIGYRVLAAAYRMAAARIARLSAAS